MKKRKKSRNKPKRETMAEITSLRTANTKTFDLGNGQRSLRARAGAVHYKDGADWRTIDNSLNASAHPDYVYENGANDFKVYFKDNLKSKGAVRFESGTAFVDITILGVALVETQQDKQTVFKIPNDSFAPTIEGRKISFSGVYPGVDFGFILTPRGIKEFVEISDISDVPDPTTLGYDPDYTYFALITEMEHDADSVEDEIGVITEGRDIGSFGFKKGGKNRFYSPELIGFDSSDRPTAHKMKKRVKVSGSKIIMYHGVEYSDLVGASVFPYIIDASVSVDVSAGADDGYETAQDTWSSTANPMPHGWKQIGKQNYDHDLGLRFQSIGVGQGDTIDAATITLVYYSELTSANLTSPTYAIDEDSCAAFGASARPSQRTLTTATIIWTLEENRIRGDLEVSEEIKTLVQEVVDRPGWSSGNDMGFCVFNDATGGNHYIAYASYESSSYDPPQLDITYTPGVGGAALPIPRPLSRPFAGPLGGI